MTHKYKIGQKVIITPVKPQQLSPRDSDIGSYAGQTGEVTNYYWIRPNRVDAFYIYTVRIGTGNEEIVLHEDEIEAFTASGLKNT